MKIGDKVQFLSEKGGGFVAGFRGKDIVLVEDEDGFQIPTPISEVVIMSGAEEYKSAKTAGPKKAGAAEPDDTFNMSVKAKLNAMPADEDSEETDPADFDITFRPAVVERKGGNKLNVCLCFVPQDIKNFSKTSFDCYIVNDSNFYVRYLYMSLDGTASTLRSEGEIEPNTKVHVETLTYETIAELERVRLQMLSYKRDREFVPRPVVDVQFRIDQVKFYKYHAFQPNLFFDTPSLLVPVVENDEVRQLLPIDAGKLVIGEEADTKAARKAAATHKPVARDSVTPRHAAHNGNQPMVVDLHADALLETTAGMDSADILKYQLDIFRRTLDENKQHKGRQIVFIHGKGEGVLRHAIVSELRYKYKNYRYQDASFREYGYGATQVTIR